MSTYNLQAPLPSSPARGSAEEDIRRLGPWFHNLHLPSGVQTAPNHPLGDFPRFKWEQIRRYIPADLRGKTALDIGCNAGYYTLELARRGARVTGIDYDEHYLEQARWAAGRFGVAGRVRLLRMSVFDLPRPGGSVGGPFDIVLFMGVLYHLRYPLLGLEVAASMASGMFIFQSLTTGEEDVRKAPPDLRIGERRELVRKGWPRMSFVERSFASDQTNWWVPNAACCEAMLRTAGLRVRSRPGHEIYVCVPRDGAVRLGEEARCALGLDGSGSSARSAEGAGRSEGRRGMRKAAGRAVRSARGTRR